MLFFFMRLRALPNTSNLRDYVTYHRLKQMAKPVGTSIRERNTTLGAFGNVLNVRAKV